MRADMGKVLVERPRIGRADRNRKKGYRKAAAKALAAGGGPAHEGMKARTPRSKFFNEHLGPLRRFLNANVGRPWDKVYSEICEHVDRGNVVQKHILTHLFEYVVTEVQEIDGEPFDTRPRWRQFPRERRSLLTHGNDRTWYVCPRTGLLRRSQRRTRGRRHTVRVPRRVWVSDTELCLQVDGRWSLVSVVRLTPWGQVPKAVDAVSRRPVGPYDTWPWRELYGVLAYAAASRPLSRAEQKRLPIPIDWVT